MPWCPKCKTEYREGFTACSDCGSPLEEALEEGGPVQGRHPDEKAEPLDEPALLMQVSNVYEADNIIALLAGEGIPAYMSHKGSGQYLSITMGMSSMGVDIFVPKSALQQAREIIEQIKHDGKDDIKEDIKDGIKDSCKDYLEDHLKDDTNDSCEEQEAEFQQISSNTKRVRFARFLLIPFVFSLAYLLITLLIQAAKILFG